MRHQFLLVMVAFGLLGLSAHANATTEWTVGVKGGLSVANMGGNDAGDAGSRTGFAGGLFAQADFSRNVGMRLEGLYTMKGATDDYYDTDLGLDVSSTLKLDYIEFPILLVVQAPLGEDAALSVFTGPTLGFNTTSELELEALGLSVSGDVSNIAAFEFGLTIGAGVNFDAGPCSILIDGRYARGMTTIDDSSDPDDLKNSGWLVMAGVGFPVGGTK